MADKTVERLTSDSKAAADSEATAAFEQEMLPLLDEMYAAALTLTRNPTDAADLVQDTFLRAYANFARYQPGTNARAWLYRILMNRCIEQYRKQKREPKSSAVDSIEDWQMAEAAHQAGQPLRSAESLAMEQIGDERIKSALAELPDNYRAAIYLSDVAGFSYREIAELLDVPRGTVMSRIHRGRARLRDALSQRGLTGIEGGIDYAVE